MSKFFKRHIETAILLLAGGALFFAAAEVEFFEAYYHYSRAHEDWELDEIFTFFLVGVVFLTIKLISSNRRLIQAVRDKSAAERHARHLSRHDALTGLHNRRHFVEAMEDAIDAAGPGRDTPCVMLLDLDRFKQLNDLRGHEAGDLLLQRVAARINEASGDDHVVARLGGDEFAILLCAEYPLEAATSIARRILTSLERSHRGADWSTKVGASIGIAEWKAGLDAEQLMRNADQAMYQAKGLGRGRFAYFDDEMGERMRAQAAMETALRNAVDAGEITPFFQPLVEIRDGRLKGFEVLARWNSAEFGMVPPRRFIQMAEDIGLIGPLSWQVLRKACVAAADWDPELWITFNLSPKQFADAELKSKIERILGDAGLPATRLEIEITENAVIEDMEAARHAIQELQDIGVRVALDDFGTGFSSLATLSKLPFNKLKIDRSFVSAVKHHPGNAKIVRAILSLAQSMELGVTAEGIETPDDLEFLADLNCDIGQGYLFERPLPLVDVERLLAGSHDRSDPSAQSQPPAFAPFHRHDVRTSQHEEAATGRNRR